MKQIIEIEIERTLPTEIEELVTGEFNEMVPELLKISENVIREAIFDNTGLLSSNLKTVKSYLVDDNGKEVV